MIPESGKSQGTKVVLSKLQREEYSRFQKYCDVNGETINSCIKRMIFSEINNPQPTKIAGKSIFGYNKQKDNFSWKVVLDDHTVVNIDENLPASSIEQLLESLMDAVDERRLQIKKETKGSVSLPTKLMRKKNEG